MPPGKRYGRHVGVDADPGSRLVRVRVTSTAASHLQPHISDMRSNASGQSSTRFPERRGVPAHHGPRCGPAGSCNATRRFASPSRWTKPPRPPCWRGTRPTRSSARPTSCAGAGRSGTRPTRRASRSATDSRGGVGAPASSAASGGPNFTMDEWHECDGRCAATAGDRGAGRRGIRDMDRGAHRHLDLRRPLVPEPYRGRRIGWTDVWSARRPGLQPVRAPGHRAALRRRHEHAWSCWRSRTRAADRAAADGRVRAAPSPASALRDDLKPLEIRPARGRLVHPRRPRAAWQQLVDAAGLQPPRGPRDPQVGYEDGDACGRSRTALVRRDGRALPRPDARPQRAAPRSTSASGAWAS